MAGGSRSGGGKLGLLINKLHTFLAVSVEPDSDHNLPGHWSGERLIPVSVSPVEDHQTSEMQTSELI